jgi:glycosyltransferase involved in cell wall biosynthesis
MISPNKRVQAIMPEPPPSQPRISVDGKFFRAGKDKFYFKGVTYGPFAGNLNGEPFASPEQTRRDFEQIQNLGANLLRIYDVPPRWFLNLANDCDLRVIVDVPWNKHLCFLDDQKQRDNAIGAVSAAAKACAGHPAVMAISVVNEISPDVVRWSGATEISEFIDELVECVKVIDPACLCTYANYPPTEFLNPQNIDFLCFNVYLHNQKPFENYLGRLQMMADTKPLILGECGIDSIREGEARKCEILEWQIGSAFRHGLAGAIVFSYTDDWVRNDKQIEDWAFGLTTQDRRPKASFTIVKKAFEAAPHFELNYYPKVSIVVATYNGASTLDTCLKSLEKLNYPNYETILVDDGSTDETPKIVDRFKSVRFIRYADNQGLSVARNTGIAAADGEIVAFTDSDCRADEDWLYYLVHDLLNSKFAGIGGHNLLPPDDSWVASAVMVSPGGPAHVMLTDRIAEHIPGCNMAFYKWALEEIGCFDPIYRKAGDDVDICWRLQQNGYKIGFSPSGFVWHYRRSTMRAYLKQQYGYGEAEALLVRKHPEYFNRIGGSVWRGRIYTTAKPGIVTGPPMIYHGAFGAGLFQSIYRPQGSMALMFLTSLEYYIVVVLPLIVLGLLMLGLGHPYFLTLTVVSLLLPPTLCVAAALQADIPRKKTTSLSRPLVAFLFHLQPIVRGWARYRGRLQLNHLPLSAHETFDSQDVNLKAKNLIEIQYWGDYSINRMDFLQRVLVGLEEQKWHYKIDAGWSEFDVEIYGSRWCQLHLTTVSEPHKNNKQMLRCRLDAGWSLLAKLSFWSVVGIEIVAFAFNSPQTFPLFALMLGILFLIVWLLWEQEKKLQRIIALFLDAIAIKQTFIKIDPGKLAEAREKKTQAAKASKPAPPKPDRQPT